MAVVPQPMLSMVSIYIFVKKLLKLPHVNKDKRPHVNNDNKVFRLHYRLTTATLLLFGILVTFKHYVGDPIHCIVSGVDEQVMATYCWIQSTFTLPGSTIGKKVGKEIPYPGVATPEEGDERKYHKYYQWVGFTLIFQAMLFRIPHYLWKTWEGGKCKMMVMDLQCPILDEETRHNQCRDITSYFKTTLHHHNFYAIRFFCCEALNFVNVVAQIFFMDLFLGYEFTTYGSRVVKYSVMDQQDRPDPMALVFPKMTKCTFHKYGASGTVQRFDGLCVLPVNILNEKIYVALWFWFIILAVVTGFALLYQLALLLSPQLRLRLLTVRTRLASMEDVATVTNKLQIGDWFLLCQMSKNMDPLACKELFKVLALGLKKDAGTNSQEQSIEPETKGGNFYRNIHLAIPPGKNSS